MIQYEKLSKNPILCKALEDQIEAILESHKGEEMCSHQISGQIHVPDAIEALKFTITTPAKSWNIASVVGSVAMEMSKRPGSHIKQCAGQISPVTHMYEENWIYAK